MDVKRYAFTDSLRKFHETIIAAAERPKLSCARDTLSVLDTQAL